MESKMNDRIKKWLVSIICVITLYCTGYSQVTIPMVDTTNQWNIANNYTSDDAIKPYDRWTTSFYRIDSPISFLGNTYRKISLYHDSLFQKNEFINYIREEQGKVFLSDSISEFVLFDFNMKAGDSILIPYYQYRPFYQSDYQSFLIKVDSTYYTTVNDTLNLITMKIKAFPYRDGTYKYSVWVDDIWVEGVGSLKYGFQYGNYYSRQFLTGGGFNVPYLLCFHHNGQLIYQNPDFSSCEKYLPDDWFEQHLISESKLWTTVAHNLKTTTKQSTPYGFAYYTKIDGIKYNRLYKMVGASIMEWPLHSLWYEKNDSVFMKLTADDKFSLIYDFNLQKNDSFLVANTENHYLIVDSVAQKEWGAKQRKHIYLHSSLFPENQTVWIEGVGNPGDFTKSTNAGETNVRVALLCFEENGQQLYQNPEYNSCYVNTVSSQQVKSQTQLINIFSTEKGMMKLQLKNESKGNLILYSMNGDQLINLKINNKETIFNAPASGVLLYSFTTDNGEVQTGKVLVE